MQSYGTYNKDFRGLKPSILHILPGYGEGKDYGKGEWGGGINLLNGIEMCIVNEYCSVEDWAKLLK